MGDITNLKLRRLYTYSCRNKIVNFFVIKVLKSDRYYETGSMYKYAYFTNTIDEIAEEEARRTN